MSSFEKRDPKKGFTLIEVVIAFTIIAMLAGVLMGVMRLGIRSWEKGQAKVDEYQHLRTFMEQIAEDIRSAYRADSNKVISFTGEGNKLTFHTATKGLTPASQLFGLRRVSYYVDTENRLIMEESYPFDEEWDEKEAVPIFMGVKKIGFRYYQVKKDELDDWVGEWDSKEEGALPHAVEITISLGDEQFGGTEIPTIIIPISIRRTFVTSAVRAGARLPSRGGNR